MFFFYTTSIFISVSVVFWAIKTWKSHDDWKLFGPFGVLMACFFAYCGFGPALVMTVSGEDNYFGYFYKDYARISAAIALTSFFFSWLGHSLIPDKKKNPTPVMLDLPLNINLAWKRGLLMYFIVWFALLISHQFNIGNMYNILGGERGAYTLLVNLGGFQNYVKHFGEALQATSIFLLAISMLSERLLHKLVAYSFLFNCVLIIVATGFRQQLAFLFFACLCLFVLYMRRNPMWRFGLKQKFIGKTKWIVFSLFFLIAAMSVGRGYGSGINLEKVHARSVGEILVAPLGETASVYFCGGIAADYAQETGKYIGLAPVKATLLRAIPKQWIGEKALPPTLEILYESLGGSQSIINAGMAVLCFTEYFLMFSWIGLALFSFFLGCCCKWIENYKNTRSGFLVSIGYILTSGYVFIYFHRGMMGQQMDGLVFSVFLPILMMKFFNALSAFDFTRRITNFLGKK